MVEFVKLKRNKDTEPKKKPLFSFKALILFTIFFFIISSLISGIIYTFTPKIGVIKISGPISIEKETTIYGSSTSSRETATTIRTLADDSSVKAILIDINSGGGSPVASEEISKSIEYAKEKKPVYSLINDIGASGAFWISVTANKTFASSMSIVGSIGVTSTTLGFEDLIKEYNITYRKQTAGKFKDIGSPFRKPLPEEQEILQNILDEIQTDFIEHVAKNRNMQVDDVKKYATGEIFLGSKAKEIGFIDEIGYYPDVISELKNITDQKKALVVEYGPEPTLAELLGVNNIFKLPGVNTNINLR